MSYRLMSEVLSLSQGGPIERLVLIALAERANKTGQCWPSLDDIGARTGLGRTAICAALGRLERRGELRRKRRRRQSTLYTIRLPAEALGVREADVKGTVLKSTSRRKKSARRTLASASREPEPVIAEPVTEPITPADAPAAHRRKTLQRVITSTTSQIDPHELRIGRLLQRFAETHEDRLGTKYLSARARDTRALQRALAVYDEPTVASTIPAFFHDRDARLRYGATVPQLVDRVPTLAAQLRPCRPTSALPSKDDGGIVRPDVSDTPMDYDEGIVRPGNTR
jgi:hypothetical protein